MGIMKIEELKALEAKATLGPWKVEYDGDASFIFTRNPSPASIASVYSDMKDTDCDLIAALRNHASALIACAEALKVALEHAEYDDGSGNNDASVLRGRLATIKDSAREALRQLEEQP